MIPKIIQQLINCAGVVFILLGILGVFFGLIEMIDPVGSKMSDDADPFGVPRSFSETLNLICFWGILLLLGMWLLLSSKSIRNTLFPILNKDDPPQ